MLRIPYSTHWSDELSLDIWWSQGSTTTLPTYKILAEIYGDLFWWSLPCNFISWFCKCILCLYHIRQLIKLSFDAMASCRQPPPWRLLWIAPPEGAIDFEQKLPWFFGDVRDPELGLELGADLFYEMWIACFISAEASTNQATLLCRQSRVMWR
jgi:hypothetical protein